MPRKVACQVPKDLICFLQKKRGDSMEEMRDRIAAARKLAGLTQEQLGERLGVTRQAVSKWESGQTVPDAVTVGRLCEVLHVSADYVLLGKEPEESGDQTPPAYTLPDTCPCCGRDVEGSICPTCGYPLPTVPPRGPRYALVATSQYYANVHAEDQLMRFCGMTREQAQQVQRQGSCGKVILRRDLTDHAVQYLTSHLNRDLFPWLSIVEDNGEPEDMLKNKPSGMELPPQPSPEHSSIGFWGVVGAVIVALLILSIF